MRKSRTSLLALIFVVTAALHPGVAVFASGPALASCVQVQQSDRVLVLRDAKIIVVASVAAEPGATIATLRPEAYLKGPASGSPILLRRSPDEFSSCPIAGFADGSRVLAILRSGDRDIDWPFAWDVYLLKDGVATNGGAIVEVIPEAELIRSIRDITGQYAVPAKTSEEGASIDWVGTVVPMTAALLVVFAISLVLMRTWHRIDPS